MWTAARVATLIGRKSHVSYSVSGATRLMHQLVWKEATWAEVKEPGRPAGATSASRTKPGSPGGLLTLMWATGDPGRQPSSSSPSSAH
ncbi:winged helix-turn-helix domain-containing protein [Streptomyces eurythermus]